MSIRHLKLNNLNIINKLSLPKLKPIKFDVVEKSILIAWTHLG